MSGPGKISRFICVHGHFYQPPRENPWTLEVETEDSAFPFHDWNERIFHECYGPNAASPLLDGSGRIAKILNNYEHVSFNFGPTLLSWMERHHPQTYRRIIDADRVSRERHGGHGNALAQVYNHIIMPLASRRDKWTQVRWGKADFKARFHREPEGMWLAETAVDRDALEALIAEDILFTVLAPAQAARIRAIGEGDAGWSDVSAETLDTTRPYRWFSRERRGRFIDLFFYNGPIANAVSFERLLNSGDVFAKRLLSAFKPANDPQLAHIATDGENYGHHHRFGNMALSFALESLLKRKDAKITNYGEFLSMFPPTQEVDIRPDTAWSCAHGVGRWKEDCGCCTGAHPDWNQKWRGPLRESLNWLAEKVDSFYAARIAEAAKDAWGARDAYIERMLDLTPHGEQKFLSAISSKHLTPSQAHDVLRLQEMQKYRLLMFTSCGWFFDDISGIEPVQILKYAARAIDIALSLGHPEGAGLESGFEEKLSKCVSNSAQHPSGADVYRRLAAPLRVDLRRAAAHFAIQAHLELEDAAEHLWAVQKKLYGRASLLHNGEEKKLTVMHLTILQRATLEELDAVAAVLHHGRVGIDCLILEGKNETDGKQLAASLILSFQTGSEEEFAGLLRTSFPGQPYTLDALFSDQRRKVLGLLLPPGSTEKQKFIRTWLAEMRRLRKDPSADLSRALSLLASDSSQGTAPDALPEADVLRERITADFRAFLTRPDPRALRQLCLGIGAAREAQLHLNLWEIQQLYWDWLGKWNARLKHSEPELAEETGRLGKLLNFAPLDEPIAN